MVAIGRLLINMIFHIFIQGAPRGGKNYQSGEYQSYSSGTTNNDLEDYITRTGKLLSR